jgi:putative hemolysin
METMWLETWLIFLAILANGFFSGSEIALLSARPARLAQLRDEGVRGASDALALKREPETFLATVQIAITLVGTLASAVGGAAAVEAFTPWLEGLPLPGAARWAEPVSLGFVILAITYASLVIGELVPKAVALRNPERAAALVAPAIQAIIRAAAWPSRGLTRSTRVMLTLIGLRDAPTPPLVSEEEIRYLVREGATQGVLERHESDLVDRVFRFTDTPVRAVMVPRSRVLALELDTPPEAVLSRAATINRARIPVIRGSLDDVAGVIVIKDLLRAVATGKAPVLAELLHPPLFVPKTARTSEVLRTLQRSHQNLALIVDEYGQTVGLVTVEDLIEEIVGEIRGEREPSELPYLKRLPDGSLLIDGAATVHDLRVAVGVPIEESADYQTIAGFMLAALNTVPQPGASVSRSGYTFTVEKMDGPRIAALRVRRSDP